MISDNIGDVPFDLQPLRVIIYDKNDPAWGAELKTSITEFLQETLGDTTSAVPSMFRRVVKSQAPIETKTEMRLDELERRVAALGAGARSFARVLRSPGDLYRLLRSANSRAEAIEITRSAIGSGMPLKVINKVLRDAISPSEANSILGAIGLRRPFRN